MHDEHTTYAAHPAHQRNMPGRERTRALERIRCHLLSFPRVWHVGTLNHADKGTGSLEGAGISVSLHPQAWQRIAHLSGAVFRLTKPSASFVDMRACLRDQPIMRAVCRWANEQGYVERRTIYRVTYYDDEQEDWLLLSFLTHKDAREEYDYWREALSSPTYLHTFQGYAPTTRMARRALHNQPPLALVKDFALAFFAEDLLPEVDGLWWDDDYRPAVLSAPRGAIFADKLTSWTATRIQRSPPTRPLERLSLARLPTLLSLVRRLEAEESPTRIALGTSRLFHLPGKDHDTMATHTAPGLGELAPGGRCSRYQIIEAADGFLVEGRERVPVRVALSASRTSLLITDDTKNYADEVGIYAYRPLLGGIASRAMGQWSQPADRPESPWSGLATWALSQTRKALASHIFHQWRRLLETVPEQVRLVAKATFAATGSDSTLGCETWPELYDYPFLVQDILRFRAAATACRQPFPLLERTALVTRLRASDQSAWRQGRFAQIYERFWLPWRGGREAALPAAEEYAIFERNWRYATDAFLQTVRDPQDRRLVLEALASDWKGCFSSTGRAYRSLNRTLMGLPGAIPTSLLSYLPTVALERPMTDRLELLLLLLYVRVTGIYAPDSRCEYCIFARASRKDILAALRRLGEHTRQELRPKSAHLLMLVQVLCDYCQQGEHYRGTIPGLLDRAIRWHRDLQERYVKDMIGQLDGEAATARPPIALPTAPAIRFLSTVGEVIEEGVTMQHCIASFARWAADGQGYLFHVEHQGASASVQVDRWGQVVQAYGPRNTLNAAADYGRRLLTRWGSPLREALPNPPGLDDAPLDELPF